MFLRNVYIHPRAYTVSKLEHCHPDYHQKLKFVICADQEENVWTNYHMKRNWFPRCMTRLTLLAITASNIAESATTMWPPISDGHDEISSGDDRN
jgi:hypothetical protein